ncbi:bifunctional metallophosphatase/5'-nucleotidase [Thiohalocapsa marina]|uniref:Bifunctional metallophosphatase/5'-nucleotidase n=1 Tax=Thiohalocapsa marina TaxID=424902 RepID=A0A5M8FV57_9GAMM|nr:bifunctional UDP-sugar hydrolase/5'-nucleotidase [Thiohalocapsa marina]KAA6187704.1 bifunctional metallophosphatase/5'-nucleotidase [Thiohalocapsa marina]
MTALQRSTSTPAPRVCATGPAGIPSARARRVRLALVWLLLWLLVWLPLQAQGGQRLTILHFNDFHGQLQPMAAAPGLPSRGGIARLASAVQAVRSQEATAPVLLLFAGDLLQGTPTSTAFLGRPDLDLFADIGVDAAVMGNHELDFGQDNFRALLAAARFPLLAANVRASPEPFATQPWVLLQPAPGLRVALLGLVTQELTSTTHPRHTRGIQALDPIHTARHWVSRLRPEADLLVVLSHLGVDGDRALARAVPGIDVIIGGHDHLRLTEPLVEAGVPILQAGARGADLGWLSLALTPHGMEILDYRLMPIDQHLPEQPVVAARVAELQQGLDAELSVVVGRLATDLDARREVIRRHETGFGNLVADLARRLTASDVALFNAGGFRASIPAGPVSLEQIYTALPFGGELVTGTLDGAQLQQALAQSAELPPQNNPGGFLQVSGVRLVIDDGQLSDLRIGDAPVEPGHRYRVVMPDFLAAGGDGYEVLSRLQDPVRTGWLVTDMLIEALRNGEPLRAATDGRIQRRY